MGLARVAVANGPDFGGRNSTRLDAAWEWVHERPLLHFAVSEIQAGIASFSVYAFFVIISYLTEAVTVRFPLRNPAPAHFLDLALAWGAAFSGSITFIGLTICSILRLFIQLWRRAQS